jgi:serine-type D-Ala-D-Ala carboxypeptidase/endopeptidase (penicillin-binding protein 4)
MKRSLLYLATLIIFYSCSPTQQIRRNAEKGLLHSGPLQTAHVGISIFDPVANKYLYNYQGDKYFVPASNTKIPTCYAAMKYLGDSLIGFRYTAADKSILIEPSGDPSFLHSDFKTHPAYQRLLQYESITIQKPLFEDEFIGSGWSWNDFKEAYMAQRSNLPIYGNTVRLSWKDAKQVQVTPSYFSTDIEVGEPLTTGFTIEKPWEENRFIALVGNAKNAEVPFRPTIGTIQALLADTLKRKVELDVFSTKRPINIQYSQPTDSLLKPMMHRSDNFFAEQSLLMVSNEYLGEMKDNKIIDTLLKTAFNDLPQKPRWVDGSGLSRYNLFTPQDFITILNKMKNEFGMERIQVIFPTGNEGTLTNYYKDLNGKLFAKTGTLSGVVALSGFMYTKKNKLLLFSVLVNNHQGTSTNVRRAVEHFLKGVQEKF